MSLLDSREGYPADVQNFYDAQVCSTIWDVVLYLANRELQEIVNEEEYALNHTGEDGDYAGFDEFCDALDIDVDESMDGDHDSAMESAGFGTDEDYNHYDYDDCDY